MVQQTGEKALRPAHLDGDGIVRPSLGEHHRHRRRDEAQAPRRYHSGQASQAAPFPQGKGHTASLAQGSGNTGCPFRYFTRHTHSDADPHAGTYSDPHSHTETDFDPDPNSEANAHAHSDTGRKAEPDSGARGDTQADSEAHCKTITKTIAKTLSEGITETLGKSIASSFPKSFPQGLATRFPAQFAETLRRPPSQIPPQDRG